MSDLQVKVVKKQAEAENIVSFELASVDGQPLPPFSAGAHIDVRLGENLTRQYSLCNDPAELHRYVICVLRDDASRGGSIAMHERVREGDLLGISFPKNHFPLVPAKKTLLFAGGIGITPILCMAERLAAAGADFELHYSTRSVERTAFLDRIKSASFAGKVTFHIGDGDADRLDAATAIGSANQDAHLYVCGPTGFIDHIVDTAKRLFWASDHVHFEHFGTKITSHEDDEDFSVQIASSGKRYAIPTDKTVTQVLTENGLQIPVSCEQGVCGTCVTRILAGVPDHRDMYFTDEERARNDQFTPCCSRAKDKILILDL